MSEAEVNNEQQLDKTYPADWFIISTGYKSFLLIDPSRAAVRLNAHFNWHIERALTETS